MDRALDSVPKVIDLISENQSGTISRRPLLHLPLTGNHRRCAINGAMNGGHGQRNGTILRLLTNPASACNITMVGFEFEDIVERGC
ncbi:hypothetical protein TNCV_1158641 [Trichonephila clavipes]|nr:hypothetical protein TNCV_1158641 [Trichonephila clavipes]